MELRYASVFANMLKHGLSYLIYYKLNISNTGLTVPESLIPLVTLVFFHAIFDYFMQGPPGEIGLSGPMGQLGEQVKRLC